MQQHVAPADPEGVGTIRHLSTKVHWLQQLSDNAEWSWLERAHPQRAALTWGTKSLPVRRLRQLRQWNGLEDGQDEDEQRRVAVQTISDPGQGDGGVPGSTGEPSERADIHIKLHSARYPGRAPFQLPDPRQPARSLIDLLTVIAALFARRQHHNASLLHSAWTVHALRKTGEPLQH